jgi:hypothetical protein
MLRHGKRIDPKGKVLQTSRKTTSRDAAKTMPGESGIAAMAHELWFDRGCPARSGGVIWSRAGAILTQDLPPSREDLSGSPPVARRARTQSELLSQFRWEGHWEVWESEWGGPRWIWD